MPGAMIRDKQLPTPPPEGSKYPGLGMGNASRAKHMKGSSSGSISKRLASGSSQASNGAKRTAYGSGSVDNMNKGVDVSDDLLIRLLAQRALSDTAESHILNPEEIEELKNEQSLLKSMIESTGRKLMLEQKVKQAAQSLYRLEYAASKRQRSNSSVNANSHLDTAQKKCDEISAELWRLQSLEMDIERRLMNHNAAVLGLGMNIMEKKAMEGRMNDDFGEGHLYIGQDHEDDESPLRRFSISRDSRSRSISGNSAQTAYGISTIPSAEVTEAQTRLRQLNFQIATIARTDISPASDNLLSYIDQLERNFQTLNTAHTTVTRDLQTSLSESQRVIETLKLRERDQSAAITENTARIEDLERRLLHTQREFDRVQNKLDDQDALVDNLKQELDTAREEARIAESVALGREAESLRREKSLRRGETERYTNDLAQRDRSIAELSSQLSNIQQQHGSQSQISRDLQSKLDTQTQQHDLAIRDLETQLVMLKSETAMLKAEKDEILGSRQQRAEEARKQRELDEQREKYRTSVADESLVQELEVLKKRNSQLTRDLQYSESERQSTEQTLSRQIELLEKQVSDHADTVVVSVDRGGGQAATDRERILEERCKELQDELSSILDDFERLTSQFIDHEAFRQNLESQIDVLRGQCHNLQTELAEEKVRHLGRDATSPVQGGFSTEQTSTGTLRTEFRKMVAELRNEHVTALKVEYDERRKLEGVIRELKKEKDRERYTAGRNGEK